MPIPCVTFVFNPGLIKKPYLQIFPKTPKLQNYIFLRPHVGPNRHLPASFLLAILHQSHPLPFFPLESGGKSSSMLPDLDHDGFLSLP